MSVVFDNGVFAIPGVSTSSFNMTTMTVGTGGNRLLLAFASAFTAISSLAAVWDSGGANQAMTLVNSQANVGASVTMYMFRLLNPVPGNKTLAWTWTTASNNIGFFSHSWVGVNQGAPLYSTVFGNGSTATPTTTVNSALTGDVAVGNFQTTTHALNSVSNTPIILVPSFGAGSNYANGAGSNITLTGAASASDNWIGIGTAIAAADGGSSQSIYRVRGGGWDW